MEKTGIEFDLTPRTKRTIKVEARGELFRIVQMRGNLFVCSKAHGNCCCGWTEKGRAPVNTALYETEWEKRRLRNKLHLSFTGCLGPCAVGNTAMLQLDGRSIWFKDLNDDQYPVLLFDYIEALLLDPAASPPAELAGHIYDRYIGEFQTVSNHLLAVDQLPSQGGTLGSQSDDLEGLDPVCLMEVDPATARWRTEYAGKEFYFCAPSCKKLFESAPQAYL